MSGNIPRSEFSRLNIRGPKTSSLKKKKKAYYGLSQCFNWLGPFCHFLKKHL